MIIDDDKKLDDLVALYERAMERPELKSLVESATSEFLASEAAMARAAGSEALAFRMIDKKAR